MLIKYRMLRGWALICVLGCSGCVFFDHAFDQAARSPVDPTEPAVGAWKGTWSSGRMHISQTAKAIVAKHSDHSCNITLAMWGRDGIWEEGTMSAITMNPAPNGGEQFECQYPLPGGVMQLDGTMLDDSMVIKYQAHDASEDFGMIDLKCVRK